MADRKSGPVKPPVIDLTARDATRSAAEGGKTAAKTPARPKAATETSDQTASPAAETGSEFVTEAPRPAEPPRATPTTPPPPRPQARLAMPWSAISIAAAGGALLGTGLTYLLASWIALPSSAPRFDDPAPVLAEQAERVSDLEQRFAAVEEAALDTQLSLDATITQLDSGFADIRKSIEEVRATMPAPVTVDLSGIEEQLRTLESRVDAVGAGASSADAGALAKNLVAMEAGLAELTTRMSGIDQQFATINAAIDRFAADLGAAKSAIAAQNLSIGPSNLGPAIKLPLVVSGLETAFAAGRPYATELESLKTILPDLAVPAALEASASTGLSRPDDLASRFATAVPAILAGRTQTTTGDWARDALEWAKALLALRPSGEIEGDTPEAVISRLEAAIGRRDFVAAAALVQQLPEPMRFAAEPLASEIAALAEAETFIAALRAQALAPVAAEANP
jgi:hypothetical protein